MIELRSDKKNIPHSDEKIYNMLSDLSNLEKVKDRIPEDKLKDLSFTSEEVSFTIAPIGKMNFIIGKKEPCSLIEYRTKDDNLPLLLRVILEQIEENRTELTLVLEANVSPIMKPMVEAPAVKALNGIADLLEKLYY